MASQEFKTHRVTELPAVLDAYAVYFVAPVGTTDYVEIYVTSSDGTSARRVINEQNVSSVEGNLVEKVSDGLLVKIKEASDIDSFITSFDEALNKF